MILEKFSELQRTRIAVFAALIASHTRAEKDFSISEVAEEADRIATLAVATWATKGWPKTK